MLYICVPKKYIYMLYILIGRSLHDENAPKILFSFHHLSNLLQHKHNIELTLVNIPEKVRVKFIFSL